MGCTGPYLYAFFFFLNDPAPPEISPLPLHDALPILPQQIGQEGAAERVDHADEDRSEERAADRADAADHDDDEGEDRSEEHTSELQSRSDLVCRLLLEKKKKKTEPTTMISTLTETTI